MMPTNDDSENPTTNEDDQRKAAELQARLRNNVRTIDDSSAFRNNDGADRLPSVEIAEGRHKYVLIKATWNETGEDQYIVTSRKRASYHRDAAEPMIEKLEQYLNGSGYSNIEVTGGGRINFDVDNKIIEIFGHSYGFGLANHEISRMVVLEDPRYQDYSVTWSNDGY
jgi:Janus/Ocnus family (Ocnus)